VSLYFVIDTDSFAGNYERPLCAFMTGQIGECGVGKSQQAIFELETTVEQQEEMEELIGTEPDDHGCCRPARIWPNPAWFNDGSGGHFRVDDPAAPAPEGCYADSRWPAYFSVAISLNDNPTDAQITLLKGRAELFASSNKSLMGSPAPFKITGFRVVRTRVVEESAPV